MVFIDELEQFGIDVDDSHKDGILIIDVFTVWCGPCKWLSPILEKLNEEGLFKLLEVDLDKNRPLGEKFGITAIPTLLFFNNGKMLEGSIEINGQAVIRNGIMVGAAGEDTIRKIVEKI
ncbi:MAG: thioredoxin family protein [Candidatus Lokiarchaeota archaeon]